MQLLPGESKIATLGNITLTTRRVQYEKNVWGSKKITTIPLDHLTSCDIEAHSKPQWIVLGVLTVVLALYTQWSMLWGLSILFVLIWLSTHRKSMVLRSAGEKIEHLGSFGQWAALQEFLQKVHVAKGNQESIAAGRHEEMLAAFRCSAVQPAAPSPPEEIIKGAEVRTTVPEPTPPAPQEARIVPDRAAFWTMSSSTLHVNAAAAMAHEKSAPQETTTTEPGPASESPVFVPSGSVSQTLRPANESPTESSPLPSSELQSCEGERGFARNAPAAPSTVKSEKSHTKIIVLALGAFAIVGLFGAVIAIFRPRPANLLTPENRVLVNAELQKWSESFRTVDTAAHVSCYAPIIETYFKVQQLPREQLSRDKQKAFASITVVNVYELSNIQFSPEPNNRIAATFQKDWDYSVNLGKGFLGSEIEKLTFENISGEWKIVKEEELQVIRATRSQRNQVRLQWATATRAGVFRYGKYQSGYLADELCLESSVSSSERGCYPYSWQPWLKEVKRKVAGSQADTLDGDTGTQTPGNLVIWWDTEPRIVFSGCRPHDCPSAGAYFIVSARTRQVDIVWHNEKGVLYLGPNATLLRDYGAYALLEQIEAGD